MPVDPRLAHWASILTVAPKLAACPHADTIMVGGVGDLLNPPGAHSKCLDCGERLDRIAPPPIRTPVITSGPETP